jgi:hypothetical protein
MAVDGRVRRFDSGALQLMIRSWTVMMEDGPRLHLDLLPRHERSSPGDWRQIAGPSNHPTSDHESFETARVDMLLQPGTAYILTGGTAAELDDEADPVDRAPTAGGTLPRMGPPSDGLGPEAATPLTIGEMLLRTPMRAPRRTMLIFVPRIPPDLLRDHEALAEGTEDEQGGGQARGR